MNNRLIQKFIFSLAFFLSTNPVFAQLMQGRTLVSLSAGSRDLKQLDYQNSLFEVERPTGCFALSYFFREDWQLELSLESTPHQFVNAELKYDILFNSMVLSTLYRPVHHWFGSIFQPYFRIGAGPYYSSETQTLSDGSIRSESWISSLGGNMGVGIDFPVMKKAIFGIEYKYHFVSFKQPVGLQNDHSGGQLSLRVGKIFGIGENPIALLSFDVLQPDIYPALWEWYSHEPIFRILLENQSMQKVNYEIKIQMSELLITGLIKTSGALGARQTETLPLSGLVKNSILANAVRRFVPVKIEIRTTSPERHLQELASLLILHGRNEWNGDAAQLRYFLTPEQPEIMQLARQNEPANGQTNEVPEAAKTIFEHVKQRGVRYQEDPRNVDASHDFLQFPVETLQKGCGDCEDLCLLLASCYASAGIQTAFVDLNRPNRNEAHLFLLINTNVPPERYAKISHNTKRLVIAPPGLPVSVWIPLEPTLIDQSFEDAWIAGANEYLENAIIQQGLAKGWVRLFLVN